MTENKKKPGNPRIKMGKKGNYNESIARDYVENNFYNINISQDKTSQVAINNSNCRQSDALNNEHNLIVNSSGKWVMIKGYFYKYTTIRTSQDNRITVKIRTESAEDDVNIRALRPDSYGYYDIISFAYRNDGFLVKVESIEEELEEEICICSIVLKPENIHYGGDPTECSYQGHNRYYSADDIAELRGRRILLNDPPKPAKEGYYPLSDDAMIESLISSPLNRGIQVNSCVFKDLYSQFKNQPKKYLQISRLAAIFYLKAANVIEQVLDLSLELVEPNRIHIKFMFN